MMLKESIIGFFMLVDKTYRYRSKRRFVAECPTCVFLFCSVCGIADWGLKQRKLEMEE